MANDVDRNISRPSDNSTAVSGGPKANVNESFVPPIFKTHTLLLFSFFVFAVFLQALCCAHELA